MEEREITIKEMQKLEEDILQKFHELCEKHHLRYFLGYGSCLGAVRHNGFIPWDDDMDVLMPESDYKKLLAITKENNNGRYKMLSMEHDDKYIYPFAKYVDSYTELDEYEMISEPIGVYIDIFPMYGLPKNPKKRKLEFRKLQLLEYLCIVARKKKPIGKTAVKTLVQILLTPAAKIMGINRLNKLNLKIANKTPYKTAKTVAVLPPNYGMRECMDKSIFQKRVLHDYDGFKFYIPENYDKYLTNLYGDYMKLPPKEKRVTHHHYKVKFKNI